MRKDVLDQVVELLVEEIDDTVEDLDNLETQAVVLSRQIARALLQRKIAGKKRATQAAARPALAARKPVS